MLEKKPLAVGIEDYRRMIDRPYYYVDKTLLIKELLDRGGYVNLFTRPRRFGKTLTLSMIKTFFECGADENGKTADNSRYFDGMKIMAAGEAYTCKMGQFPVISFSLKSAKQPDFEMSYQRLLDQISREYERHSYLLSGDHILKANKERYIRIMERRASSAEYIASLEFLSICLREYHRRNVIILLDEYDVPLENAYIRGFYGEMSDYIRALFEAALKTNDALEFAVITGCLRIGRESIFTGLNNLKVYSVMDNSYTEYFGFTQAEADSMLEAYGLSEKRKELKAWYNGYLFGHTEVYNPWSVCCYVDDRLGDRQGFPRPYWSNTSSNSIVRELVEHADETARQELEELIAGGMIEKPVHEEITYGDIYSSQDNLWNFLFFTGYLRAAERRLEGNVLFLSLKIPNEEIRYIYQNTIRGWFETKIKEADCRMFYQAMIRADCKAAEEFLTDQLMESISYYDNAESFYHGYLVGILKGMKPYRLSSNKEAGSGRPDIVLSPATLREPAIVIELKAVKSFAQMEGKCREALLQIKEQGYTAELVEEGYKDILCFGICFCKKTCTVRTDSIE